VWVDLDCFPDRNDGFGRAGINACPAAGQSAGPVGTDVLFIAKELWLVETANKFIE
jgi:hypothetical protein